MVMMTSTPWMRSSCWSLAKTNTSYAYDAAGNLTNVSYPVSHGLTFGYDAINELTGMLDGVGTTTFSYTPGGQLACPVCAHS